MQTQPYGEGTLPVIIEVTDASGLVTQSAAATARLDHTAPGQELRLQSGEAFDVTAERAQTDYTQEQLAPPRRGLAPRQRVTATFRVTVTNAKPDAVTVDVREARVGTWRVTDSSLPAEKLSASEVRFRVPVPAKGDATLTYTIQVES